MFAHWTLADMSALKNVEVIRYNFDSIGKSFVTVKKPFRAIYSNRNHNKYEVEVVLRDTLLLAPAGYGSLAKIGGLIGFEKLDLSARYKENMDALLRDDSERNPPKNAKWSLNTFDADLKGMQPTNQTILYEKCNHRA